MFSLIRVSAIGGPYPKQVMHPMETFITEWHTSSLNTETTKVSAYLMKVFAEDIAFTPRRLLCSFSIVDLVHVSSILVSAKATISESVMILVKLSCRNKKEFIHIVGISHQIC